MPLLWLSLATVVGLSLEVCEAGFAELDDSGPPQPTPSPVPGNNSPTGPRDLPAPFYWIPVIVIALMAIGLIAVWSAIMVCRRRQGSPLDTVVVVPVGPNDERSRGIPDLNVFPAYKFKQDSLEAEEAQCSICLEPYLDGEDLKCLPCLHRYHASCLDSWLYNHRTCPLCKFDLVRMMPAEQVAELNRLEAEEAERLLREQQGQVEVNVQVEGSGDLPAVAMTVVEVDLSGDGNVHVGEPEGEGEEHVEAREEHVDAHARSPCLDDDGVTVPSVRLVEATA